MVNILQNLFMICMIIQNIECLLPTRQFMSIKHYNLKRHFVLFDTRSTSAESSSLPSIDDNSNKLLYNKLDKEFITVAFPAFLGKIALYYIRISNYASFDLFVLLLLIFL